MKKLLVLPLISLVLLTGCSGGKKDNQNAEQNVPAVKVETVRQQAVEQIREYTGTIAPYTKNMIASQSAMRIEKIYVEVGDYVKAGQLLVQMEETNFLQAKLQLENLKTDYVRVKALFESGGISKQQLDQLQTQLSVTEETVINLEKNTRLLSPITGVVTQRMFDNGDITGGQPILSVQQLSPVKISINIQEEYFPVVKTKMSSDIFVDVYSGEKFNGQVSLIYPTVDAITHTFTTEITYNNNNMRLRPGMFARVAFNFGTANHVVVPDKAVIKQTGTNDRYVFVWNNDNTVSYKKVELGRRMNDTYEIISGINDGDKVVVAGMSRLVEGTTVKVVE